MFCSNREENLNLRWLNFNATSSVNENPEFVVANQSLLMQCLFLWTFPCDPDLSCYLSVLHTGIWMTVCEWSRVLKGKFPSATVNQERGCSTGSICFVSGFNSTPAVASGPAPPVNCQNSKHVTAPCPGCTTVSSHLSTPEIASCAFLW